MKSVTNWNGHGGGSNASGLNIFPAGQVNLKRAFSDAGDGAYLWTTSVGADLKPGFEGFNFDSDVMSYNIGSEMMGCSVRCVRNN